MYHRARMGPDGNAPEMLDAHFASIASRCRAVLPGEPLARDRLNVCLSFDDGYFDFFATVFPLLRKHGLRALLAIPPAVIQESCQLAAVDRLHIDSITAFREPWRGGLCCWWELQSMVASGHVTIAAHGARHVRLDLSGTDYGQEIDEPREVLRSRFSRTTDSFVFPFGRYSPAALTRAAAQYRHVFRIGGASNPGWHGVPLYRVCADAMRTPDALLGAGSLRSYRLRYWWNRLRGR